jgi:hypothetical protein
MNDDNFDVEWNEIQRLHHLLSKSAPNNDESDPLIQDALNVDEIRQAYNMIDDAGKKEIKVLHLFKGNKWFYLPVAAASIAVLIISIILLTFDDKYKSVERISTASNIGLKKDSKIKNTDNDSVKVESKPNLQARNNHQHVNYYAELSFLENEIRNQNSYRSLGYQIKFLKPMPAKIKITDSLKLDLLIYEDLIGNYKPIETVNIELWLGDKSDSPIFAESVSLTKGNLNLDFTPYLKKKGNYYVRLLHQTDLVWIGKTNVH